MSFDFLKSAGELAQGFMLGGAAGPDMLKARLQSVVDIGMPLLGRPYLFGAKWDPTNPAPAGPIDCSGFSRWCYYQGTTLLIPEGSQAQYDASDPCQAPLNGDLGFFQHMPGQIHHVGILAGNCVLEARGDDYGQVILRPRSAWEDWHEFTGWRRLHIVKNQLGGQG